MKWMMIYGVLCHPHHRFCYSTVSDHLLQSYYGDGLYHGDSTHIHVFPRFHYSYESLSASSESWTEDLVVISSTLHFCATQNPRQYWLGNKNKISSHERKKVKPSLFRGIYCTKCLYVAVCADQRSASKFCIVWSWSTVVRSKHSFWRVW